MTWYNIPEGLNSQVSPCPYVPHYLLGILIQCYE